MQTTVQNEKSVRLGNGVLKVNNVNVGLIKDASLEVTRLTAVIKAHNGKLPPREKTESVMFRATLMEINMVQLNQIYGGELTTVAAAWEVPARKVLTYDDLIRAITLYPVEFENTDADGKKFGIKLFNAYATNSLAMTFPEDDNLEATVEVPVEFGAYVNEDNQFVEIYDEQDMPA